MSGSDSKTQVVGPFGSKDRYAYPEIHRDFDCESYDHCLDIAANKNWKVFTCEGCSMACRLEKIDVEQ